MKKPALPEPNVTYLSKEKDVLDEKSIKGMVCNPIYAGVPPFRQIISDEAWVEAATQLITEEGPEQFLVNMLYMLRQSLDQTESKQSPHPTSPPKEEVPSTQLVLVSNEVEPSETIYCYHDDFPMINIQGATVCVAEYVFEHLENTVVTDLITHPALSIVFQNGHTLPLYVPKTGQETEVDDDDELLDTLTGLSVVDVEWDDEAKAVILYFGQPVTEDMSLLIDQSSMTDEPELTISVAVHLNAIREMKCPYLSGIDTLMDIWLDD